MSFKAIDILDIICNKDDLGRVLNFANLIPRDYVKGKTPLTNEEFDELITKMHCDFLIDIDPPNYKGLELGTIKARPEGINYLISSKRSSL